MCPPQDEIEHAYGEGRQEAREADIVDIFLEGIGQTCGSVFSGIPGGEIEEPRQAGFNDEAAGN